MIIIGCWDILCYVFVQAPMLLFTFPAQVETRSFQARKRFSGFSRSHTPTDNNQPSGVVCPEVVLISGPEEYLKQGLGGKV